MPIERITAICPAPYEIRKFYREGKIGEFEYAEGEYVHNYAPWHNLTQSNPEVDTIDVYEAMRHKWLDGLKK